MNKKLIALQKKKKKKKKTPRIQKHGLIAVHRINNHGAENM